MLAFLFAEPHCYVVDRFSLMCFCSTIARIYVWPELSHSAHLAIMELVLALIEMPIN